MDLIDILFSKALLKGSGGGEINNDVATKEFVNAAINAIKNGVSEEHDTLKEIEDTLTTKLTEPTEGLEVGKYFRIAAIDENGHAVLEAVEAKDVGVQDVQVAGASVVADGVASVPIANGNNAGVAKVVQSYGIKIVNGDILALRSAANDEIDPRISNYRCIVPSNIDYAVKAAMCDGKGAAWSAIEQAAARERMASKGTYRHIAKITIETEGTEYMVITVDENGNSFSLYDLIIFTHSPITADTTPNNGYFYFNNLDSGFGAYRLKGTATTPLYNMARLYCGNIKPVMWYSNTGSSGVIASSGQMYQSFGSNLDITFNTVNKIKWRGNGTIPPGTVFDIWGVDA